MPAFKPAYLIHGDDHGRIAERRARLRALAEAESGATGLELLEGEEATPEATASLLNSMTFALGRRFIVVDGAERWKDKDLAPLESALEAIPPETTVAFFAREDHRLKAPPRLHAAVRKAGGDIGAEEAVKPWQLGKWTIDRGRELGLGVEPEAARALVALIGERQQRLLRELEKLALAAGESTRIEAPDVERLVAPSAERRAWSLADAVVAGDAQSATRLYLRLRAQGERLTGLLYWAAQRVRTASEVAQALEAGQPAAEIRRRLRMPSKAAERLIADARSTGSEKLQRAIEHIADLELASRGGGSGGASEDTVALSAIQRIAESEAS